MQPERQRNRITELYHAALARPEVERDAFLQTACAGDESLRQEVESLLQYESQAARLLETPPAAVVAGAAGGADEGKSMVGRTLGPYTIVSPLGVGGMGEVYRARDSKLGRDVAIKILPPHFTSDPERRARFAREARTLATLNHPHIGAIYGLEEADGVTGLVLELVEGPTLAERLERGPLPIVEALAIGRQVAEALDTAHQKGIVHRDLKPANIVLQGSAASGDDVRAKVLDFGLAKAVVTAPEKYSTHGRDSSFDGTADGRILGTPAYMSPEQARGLAVDKRTDMWAFGCLMFEMLTGRRAFDGDTVTDTLARILDCEPDWTLLPAESPSSIRRLLERCLRKDARKRLHDIADALIEIDESIPAASQAAGSREALSGRPRRYWLALIAASLLAGVLLGSAGLGVWQARTPPTADDSLEFEISSPPGFRYGGPFPRPGKFASANKEFALAPDGRHLVAVVIAEHLSALWVRPLDSSRGFRPLQGTEGARAPFWSPDNRQIAFFANNKLMVVGLDGGTPDTVCDTTSWFGGTWNADGVILLASSNGPLVKVSPGGAVAPVTTLATGETSHRWPWFLPDGQHFLFLATGKGDPQLRVGSLASSDSAPVGTIRSNALYASGYVLFVDGGLMAQRFDVTSRRLIGQPFRLSEEVGTAPHGHGPFSASETGRLAYGGPRGVEPPQLTWFDRTGNRLGTVAKPAFYLNLDLSPDDRHVAVSHLREDGSQNIWVIDLDRDGDMRRLTTPERTVEYDPAWSPNGKDLAFTSRRTGSLSLFRRPTDASGSDQLLAPAEDGFNMSTPDWSPADGSIVFGYRGDLFKVGVGGGETVSPVLQTPFTEWEPAVSPDGRWVAFSSDRDRTGRREIYVRSLSGEPASEHKISRGGGQSPRWRTRDEIFFLAPDGSLMAARVKVATSVTFDTDIPQQLFKTGLAPVTDLHAYDVSSDGKRFLIPVFGKAAQVDTVTVVTNWTARIPQPAGSMRPSR
jgi:serine/threonine protein kinase/Tol biopolymer transport system component